MNSFAAIVVTLLTTLTVFAGPQKPCFVFWPEYAQAVQQQKLSTVRIGIDARQQYSYTIDHLEAKNFRFVDDIAKADLQLDMSTIMGSVESITDLTLKDLKGGGQIRTIRGRVYDGSSVGDALKQIPTCIRK